MAKSTHRSLRCTLFFTAGLLFSVDAATAQSSKEKEGITITGKVLDTGTKEPLNFASISVAGSSIGTVTNAAGDFDFYVPAQHSEDTLVISHLGYKSFKGRIADLAKSDQVIGLVTASLVLKEVTIEEKNLSGKEIITKAIQNLKDNYSVAPFCLEGFFREIEEGNGKYVLLTEAAIDLYDKDFDGKRKGPIQERVDLREVRGSFRYSGRTDADHITYALMDLLENNDVRYNRGMLDIRNNEFALDTIISYDDRPVFGVSMSNKTDHGMMYIDTETYGFLKISMERKSRNSDKYYYVNPSRDSLKMGRVWFRFSVEFEEYKNTLYPRRMHESEFNEIYSPKTGKIKITSVETLEFIVTQVHPDKENKQAQRLRYGHLLKTVDYHPEFWKNYNTLKLTPLNEKLIRDLEKDISLQEQFKGQ